MSIVDKVVEKIREGEWDEIYVTMDTHYENYLETQEGRKLSVKHCIQGSDGWRCNESLDAVYLSLEKHPVFIHKNTFGSIELIPSILNYNYTTYCTTGECTDIELTLVGVCTDICVVSNALLLKARFPEMKLIVDASCCAGSTPEKHKAALEVMKSCQIEVINE